MFIAKLRTHQIYGNRSKAPDKKPPGQKPPKKMIPDKKPPDNKPPRNIEEIIAKYAVDANLFRLGSTNHKKNPVPVFFWLYYRELIVGGLFSW